MKNYVLSIVYLFGLFGVFFRAEALVLDDNFDEKKLVGKKIGYYMGTFDPIHIGHEHVIETALKNKLIDYILIYPAFSSNSGYKNRSDLKIRRKMVESIYRHHPKVIVTKWSPKKLQDSLLPHFDSMEVFGIIGSDVVTDRLMSPDKEVQEMYQKVFMTGHEIPERHIEDNIGRMQAFKASGYIVALRGDIDLSHLDNMVGDRTITAFINSSNVSSTIIREAIQAKKPYKHMLNPVVVKIINQEGLYEKPNNCE